MNWKLINYEDGEFTYRMKIKDGWLVRWAGFRKGGLTFVPDKKHSWKITDKEVKA